MKNNQINLIIDGTPVTVDKGTTIMEAADQLGIHTSRGLCYHPDLSLAGSCRVCIVDVEGDGLLHGLVQRPGLPRAWRSETNSPEIRQARRDIVELILDNHPQGLPDLRARRQLRTAETGLFDGRPSSGSSKASARIIRNGGIRAKSVVRECRISVFSAARCVRVCCRNPRRA